MKIYRVSASQCSFLSGGQISRATSKSLNVAKRYGRNFKVSRRPGMAYAIQGVGDELTDFITAGRKMRKWYGQEERVPRDGGDEEEPEPPLDEDEDVEREYVLLSDADTPTGEQVLLQLILNRQKVKVLCRDVEAIKSAFGPYVTPVVGNVNDGLSLLDACKGVYAIVCVGDLGAIPKVVKRKTMDHIVLISSVDAGANKGFGLDSLFGGESNILRDPAREQSVENCGAPYTIIRAGNLVSSRGGESDLRFSSGSPIEGEIGREDLGWIVGEVLGNLPKSSVMFQVVANGSGSRPSNFEKILSGLSETTVKS